MGFYNDIEWIEKYIYSFDEEDIEMEERLNIRINCLKLSYVWWYVDI